MNVKTTKFRVEDYFDNEEDIVEYAKAMKEEGTELSEAEIVQEMRQRLYQRHNWSV